MRINVLSEIPEAWRRAVSEWMRINGRHRSKIGGAWAPDRNDEYLFYQTLIGVWPAEAAQAPLPERAAADLVARVSGYMQKAVREAKVHTSWIDEDPAYGRAVARFVEQTLSGRHAARFLRSFVPFQRRVAQRRDGQLARPTRDEAGVAWSGGLLPGQRAVGSQPGGSGQPPCGRFCRTGAACSNGSFP